MPITEQEKQLQNDAALAIQSVDHVIQPVDHVNQSKEVDVVKVHVSDDDDNDDDLVPCANIPQRPRNIPHYLREAISGIYIYYHLYG